jgi:acyl-CoA thioesterase I
MRSERAWGRRRHGRSAAAAAAAVVATLAVSTAVAVGLPNTPVAIGHTATAASASPPLRILPLGTSSTVGGGSPETAGFRGPLEALLTRDGIAYDMVGSQHSGPPSVPDLDHEGHGGWTMKRMQPLVAGWVTAARPDVILLQVGTNDLLAGTSAAATAARLDTMLTTIHSVSSASVVVAGVWAPLPTRAAARAEYTRLATGIASRHQGRGEPVTFIDTATLLQPGELFDGLHPNAKGYRKISALWERQIRSTSARR